MRVRQGLTIATLTVVITIGGAVTGVSATVAGSARSAGPVGLVRSAAPEGPAGRVLSDPAATVGTATVSTAVSSATTNGGRRTESKASGSSRLPSIRLQQRSAAVPGAPVTYLIDVRNPGVEPLPNVMVHQLLPPGLGYRSARPEPAAASQEQVRWRVSLAPGQTVRLRTRGHVSTAGTTFWNRVGIGNHPRLGTTACVAPTANSPISDCDTTLATAVAAVPWWRTWYALLSYAWIMIMGVVAGIVWFRRGRSANRSPLHGRLVGSVNRPATGNGLSSRGRRKPTLTERIERMEETSCGWRWMVARPDCG